MDIVRELSKVFVSQIQGAAWKEFEQLYPELAKDKHVQALIKSVQIRTIGHTIQALKDLVGE